MAVLSAAFLAWAGVVWNATEKLVDKIESLNDVMHAYMIATNNRVTSNEKDIERLLDEIHKSHSEDK